MPLLLPPPGKSVRYVNAGARRYMRDLGEPRMHLTLASHGTILKRLVFVEWNSAYLALDFNDALDVWSSKGHKLADVLAAEPALGMLDSRMREFVDTLGRSIERRNAAIVAYDHAARRMGAVHAYLAFWATVATPDDPVPDSELAPIEAIARAALASETAKAVEIAAQLAKASAGGAAPWWDELHAIIWECVCGLVAVFVVYGARAMDISDLVKRIVARIAGTIVGKLLSRLVGESGTACLALAILEAALTLCTVLTAPLGLTAIGLGALTEMARQAASKCKFRLMSYLGTLAGGVVSKFVQFFPLQGKEESGLFAKLQAAANGIYDKLGAELGPVAAFSAADAIFSEVHVHAPITIGGMRVPHCLFRLFIHVLLKNAIAGSFGEGSFGDNFANEYIKGILPASLRGLV